MNDVDSMFAACVANPYDHAPRLMLADALDERDLPGDAPRASFIRAQKELEDIGPPRRKLDRMLMIPRGPDYWEIDVSEHDGIPLVGERVDVSGGSTHARKDKKYHGLLVTKSAPDPYLLETSVAVIIVKKDEYSTPYPTMRAVELHEVCRVLLHTHWRDWVPQLPGIDWSDDQAGPNTAPGQPICPVCVPDRFHTTLGETWPVWDFRVGLVSRVESKWNHWFLFSDALISSTPITHVSLRDRPQWSSSAAGVRFPGDKINLEPGSGGLHIVPWPPEAKALDTKQNLWELWSDWVHDHITYFLHKRWPSIPVENWTVPE